MTKNQKYLISQFDLETVGPNWPENDRQFSRKKITKRIQNETFCESDETRMDSSLGGFHFRWLNVLYWSDRAMPSK